jgi:hypothetical protein
VVETVILDSHADADDLLAEFQRQRGRTLLTTPRKNSAHPVERQQLITVLNRPPNRRLRQDRGQTVEPRQGVVQDLFALERWGRRGHRQNRWRFAAMGMAVQRHQASALNAHRSPGTIKQAVLGL